MNDFQTICRALRRNDSTIPAIQMHSLDDDGVRLLAESLVENTFAKILELFVDGVLGKTGFDAIGNLIRHNQTLETLCISGNSPLLHLRRRNNSRIDKTGISSFGRALAGSCQLKELKFDRFEDFENDATAALFTNLANNIKIKHITLSNNDIGNDGAETISNALRVNTSICRLDLTGNNISDAGAQAIGSALRVNFSIDDLTLKCNSISDVGVEFICAVLEENSTVRRIDLSSNNFKCRGAIAIGNMLKKNKSLDHIFMHNGSNRNLGAEGKQALLSAAEHNFFVKCMKVQVDIDDLQRQINNYTTLNYFFHRQILSKDDIPFGLWAHILFHLWEKAEEYFIQCPEEGANHLWPSHFSRLSSSDVLFYFVKAKPELFKLGNKYKPQKRKYSSLVLP